MCGKYTSQWRGDKGGEFETENLLVAWTVYVKLNSLAGQKREQG